MDNIIEKEIHENCTVEILRNTATGDISIGWWENEQPPMVVRAKEDEA